MRSYSKDLSFTQRVNAVVERAAPEHRPQMQLDVETILAHNVASSADLVAIALADDTAVELARVALWLLGALGATEASGSVINALSRPDATVRAEAAKTLALLAAVDAVEPLIGALRQDPEENVREAAAYALGLLGDSAAVPVLSDVAADIRQPPALRGMAMEALSDLNATQVAELIVEALDDPSGEVRYWSAYALGRIGDKSAIPALRRRIDVDTEPVGSGGP